MLKQTNKYLDDNAFLIEIINQLSLEEFNEASINAILNKIIKFYKASRITVFDIDYDNQTVNCKYEATNNNEIKDKLLNIPLSFYSQLIEDFDKKSTVYFIEDIDDIVKNKFNNQKFDFALNNTISTLAITPIKQKEKLCGFMCLENSNANIDKLSFLAILSIIFKAKEEEIIIKHSLETFSFVDDLTKLKNKNAYNVFLQSTKFCKLKNTGVMFADINSLKYTNDTYGHQAGDNLIHYMAQILNKHFDPDKIFRISGDEFVAITENIDKQDFEILILDLKRDISLTSPNLAAIGTYWENEVFNLQQNVFFAEQDMYKDKRLYHGENTTRVVQEDSTPLNIFLDEMKKDIFTFHLHPVFSTKTGQIEYAEALSRRLTKEGKVVQPYEYIPILKKEHLIADFEMDFLDSVFKFIDDCHKNNIPIVPLKVVVADQTMLQEDFLEKFDNLFTKYNVSRDLIYITVLVLPSDKAREGIYSVIEKLHDAGTKIVVESIIGEFDNNEWAIAKGIDYIVLSRNITSRMFDNPKAYAVMENTIEFAKKLNIKTILRGVERQDQIKTFLSLKPDYLQGFFFDKPLEQEEFIEKYLLNKDPIDIYKM